VSTPCADGRVPMCSEGSDVLGDKNTQLAALAEQFRVSANQITFLDDDRHNIDQAANAGVSSVHTPCGLTRAVLAEVIAAFGERLPYPSHDSARCAGQAAFDCQTEGSPLSRHLNGTRQHLTQSPGAALQSPFNSGRCAGRPACSNSSCQAGMPTTSSVQSALNSEMYAELSVPSEAVNNLTASAPSTPQLTLDTPDAGKPTAVNLQFPGIDQVASHRLPVLPPISDEAAVSIGRNDVKIQLCRQDRHNAPGTFELFQKWCQCQVGRMQCCRARRSVESLLS